MRHEALGLIAGSLEKAVKEPENLEARGEVLLGSCLAGIAIDNCGTAIAHNISHALAALAPVHHGLATALGFELTLPWLVEADTTELDAAARACGLAGRQRSARFRFRPHGSLRHRPRFAAGFRAVRSR